VRHDDEPDYVTDKAPSSADVPDDDDFWTSAATSPLAKLDIDRAADGGQVRVPRPAAGTELTFQTRVDKIYEKEATAGR
jgi:hypothetical protein